ncbi:MAG: ABC transporter substrate-binding protein [Eubacterium sp.]|nr:ABC transporter substrate-binding protein [Eubacterium sp.]
MKKKIVSIMLSVAMCLSLAACSGSSGETSASSDAAQAQTTSVSDSGMVNESEPTYGGSMTLYYQNFYEAFDPAVGESYTYALWLESLWAPDWGINDPDVYNFDANVLPYECITGQIADTWEWEVYEDGTGSDLTVTIRDDIYFQEKDEEYDVFGGRNLTADDVVYSYDRTLGVGSYADKEAPDYGGMWSMVLGDVIDLESGEAVCEKVDDYTVVFHLKAITEAQLATFMQSMVNITGTEWETLTQEQQNDWHYACGTGPYILTDYSTGSFYKYTKNENYYDYDERYPENKLPYLDELTLTSVGDSAAIMSSFIAGDLDYISFDSSLSDDQGTELINSLDGDLQVLTYDSNASAINLKVNAEPFDDIRVRIALQKAINLEEVNSAYFGYDTELNYATLFIKAMDEWISTDEWDDELISEYSYDPEGAIALLEEAGYPDGFEFEVVTDANADADIYQLAQSYFSAIGVTMNITNVTDMQEVHSIQADETDTRAFSTHLADFESTDAALFNYATTGFAYATFHGDTKMDELLTAASAAVTSDEQATAAKAADLYFMQQHWVIALSGTTNKHEYLSSRIGGLSNGERISYSHFTKTFVARIWASE